MASLRKRNDKWQAQVRRTGYSPQTRTFHSKVDAARWIRQTEIEIDRSGLAYDPSTLERLTTADLIERYLREVTPGKRGIVSEKKRLEVFLRQAWTVLPLARLTPQTFSAYRDKRLREVAPATVRRELGLLQAVYQLARTEWDIPLSANPLAQIRKPRSPSGRTRRLRPDELQALMTACLDCRTEWLAPSIALAIETGMRRGELLNIRRRDMQLDTGLLFIPHTKTDVPRTIPLSAQAVEILKALEADVMTPDARLIPVSDNAFRLTWERCKKRADRVVPGIKDLRFHDLRHEAVSRFFELGLSLPEVALISGHRDPRMLFRYTHLKPHNVGARLNALIGAVSV